MVVLAKMILQKPYVKIKLISVTDVPVLKKSGIWRGTPSLQVSSVVTETTRTVQVYGFGQCVCGVVPGGFVTPSTVLSWGKRCQVAGYMGSHCDTSHGEQPPLVLIQFVCVMVWIRRLWSFTKSQNMKKTEFITRRVTATWQVRYQLRHVNKLDIIVMFSMKFLFLEWVTNASELGIITRATRRYKKFI